MDIAFDDDNARVLRSVHDELISAVEDDVVAVARIECHQGVTTTNCLGPSREMISKFKLRAVGAIAGLAWSGFGADRCDRNHRWHAAAESSAGNIRECPNAGKTPSYRPGEYADSPCECRVRTE